MFNWVDYLLIAFLIISMIYSFMRGFAREILSFVIWILAFWVALEFSDDLSPWMSNVLMHPVLQFAASFVILLILVLIIGALVSYLLNSMIESTGLSAVNRSLGLAFGFIRGVMIVLLVLFIAQMIYITVPNWWQHSFLVPKIWLLMKPLQYVLPDSLLQHIQIPI